MVNAEFPHAIQYENIIKVPRLIMNRSFLTIFCGLMGGEKLFGTAEKAGKSGIIRPWCAGAAACGVCVPRSI